MTEQVFIRPRRVDLKRSFPFALILLVSGVIVAGFSHTAPRVLLSPNAPPPTILYVHVILALSWLVGVALQSSLIVSGQTALHRRLGMFVAMIGVTFSVVSFYTAIIMRRLDTEGDLTANIAYLSIPLTLWIEFTITFGLAMLWRGDPRRHRPLLLINVCTAAGPALGRFPEIRHAGLFLAGLIPVLLIVAAMLHDRWRFGRWNIVYLIGAPASLAMAGLAVYFEVARPQEWVAVARWMLASF